MRTHSCLLRAAQSTDSPLSLRFGGEPRPAGRRSAPRWKGKAGSAETGGWWPVAASPLRSTGTMETDRGVSWEGLGLGLGEFSVQSSQAHF